MPSISDRPITVAFFFGPNAGQSCIKPMKLHISNNSTRRSVISYSTSKRWSTYKNIHELARDEGNARFYTLVFTKRLQNEARVSDEKLNKLEQRSVSFEFIWCERRYKTFPGISISRKTLIITPKWRNADYTSISLHNRYCNLFITFDASSLHSHHASHSW